MTYIVWKDSFNIGVNKMDEQHQQFVSYINELYDAIQAGNAEIAITKTIDNVINYVHSHFKAEELLLESINYPLLESQIKQHNYYISEIKLLKNEVIHNSSPPQNLLAFLRDWFLHHIMTEDLKYVEFVNNANSGLST